jgi:hypothetical protein
MKTYPTGAFAQSLMEYQRLRIEAMTEEINRLNEENLLLRNLTLSSVGGNFALALRQTDKQSRVGGQPTPPTHQPTEATAMAQTISNV